MKRLHSIVAGLVLVALSAPAWAIQIPVSGDTAGSTVKNTITKAAGKATTLPVSAKSTGLLFFDLSNSGIDSSAITGARLVIYLSKVTKPGNLNVAFPNTAFQETFTTATIPLPSVGGTGAAIPITAANNKGYIVISGFQVVVKSWLDTPSANLGIALTGDAALNVLLTAKEGSVGASAVLEIDVNPSGGSITAATITSSDEANLDSLRVGSSITTGGAVTAASLTASGAVNASDLNASDDLSVGDNIAASSLNLTGAAVVGGQLRAATIGVGVNGANTAGRQLQVVSNSAARVEVATTDNSQFAGFIASNALQSWYMGTRTASRNFTIFDNTSGTPRLIVDGAIGTGDVGIGQEPAIGFKLAVNGTIVCSSLIETSDARFKKDITPIGGALDKVEKLRGVSYLWRTDEFPDRKFDDARHLGFIAQEIREILPEVVKENKEGNLSVQYTGVIPVLVNAIQELKAQKNAEIAALEARLERLEASLSERPAQATTAAIELK